MFQSQHLVNLEILKMMLKMMGMMVLKMMMPNRRLDSEILVS